MQNTFTQTAGTLLNEGKKSLDTLLRESAYKEIKERLAESGVNIEDVADKDIEVLVAARVEEKLNGIKGFATGTVLALLISALVGA
jgi:hypothetical protein